MPPYFAKSQDELPKLDQILSLSGLDFMREVVAGTRPGAPIARTLGFAVTQVEEGRAVVEGQASFDAMNPMGGVHGGWYGAILDSALGCAVMTCVPKGSYYTTLEYKINISRALPVGVPVRAVGVVQHAGRSTGVATAEVRGIVDDKLYASGSTTCIIMQAPAG